MAQTPTRQRILAEAVRLFAERGIKGTTVAEIEDAAGLKRGSGSLFTHFASKEAVLEAAIEELAAQTRQGQSLFDLARLGDLRAELTVFARGALMGLDANRDLVRLWLKESDNVPQLKEVVERGLNRPAATWIADYLGAKVKAGELVEHDCEAVGTIALGAITAWWIWQQVAGPVGTDRRSGPFRRGMGGPAPPACAAIAAELQSIAMTPKRYRTPPLVAVPLATLVYVTVNIAVPLALSTLMPHAGWDGWPSVVNLMGIPLLGAGVGMILWSAASHATAWRERDWRVLQFDPDHLLTPDYLVTDGPYRYTRNPLYVGDILMWAGWAIVLGSVSVALGVAFLHSRPPRRGSARGTRSRSAVRRPVEGVCIDRATVRRPTTWRDPVDPEVQIVNDAPASQGSRVQEALLWPARKASGLIPIDTVSGFGDDLKLGVGPDGRRDVCGVCRSGSGIDVAGHHEHRTLHFVQPGQKVLR